MTNYHDFIGKRFGRLVVVEPTEERRTGHILWKCQCDCGNIVNVLGYCLLRGTTQSCGCLRKKDLLGKRFGKLVVLKPTPLKNRTLIKWECKCDCGNVIYAASNHLISGKVKSCGCLVKDDKYSQCKDITGSIFSKLTVVSKLDKRKNGHVMWKCLCECGKETEVAGVHLRSGHTKSCGCLQIDCARKMFTTHGKSKTHYYRLFKSRKRNERKKLHDTEWTLKMELTLKELQTECVICNSKEDLSVDHVLPLSRGFGLKPGNAVILCKSCNSKKIDKNINDLPLEQQVVLIWNAFKFKDHWINGCTHDNIS